MELQTIIHKEFEGADVPYIEFRKSIPSPSGNNIDIMYGACQYIDGDLIPIDGENYSFDTSCDKYYTYKTQTDKVIMTLPSHSEYTVNAGTKCLVVWKNDNN